MPRWTEAPKCSKWQGKKTKCPRGDNHRMSCSLLGISIQHFSTNLRPSGVMPWRHSELLDARDQSRPNNSNWAIFIIGSELSPMLIISSKYSSITTSTLLQSSNYLVSLSISHPPIQIHISSLWDAGPTPISIEAG